MWEIISGAVSSIANESPWWIPIIALVATFVAELILTVFKRGKVAFICLSLVAVLVGSLGTYGAKRDSDRLRETIETLAQGTEKEKREQLREILALRLEKNQQLTEREAEQFSKHVLPAIPQRQATYARIRETDAEVAESYVLQWKPVVDLVVRQLDRFIDAWKREHALVEERRNDKAIDLLVHAERIPGMAADWNIRSYKLGPQTQITVVIQPGRIEGGKFEQDRGPRLQIGTGWAPAFTIAFTPNEVTLRKENQGLTGFPDQTRTMEAVPLSDENFRAAIVGAVRSVVMHATIESPVEVE